ncbi:aldo/keto reductase [Amycolatopsis thermophila]|uniref:Aryl-alcohol dehydrogenase-like predicted oxidoreductase n=1 Tax=Amycolatopsis thermophila TaxID=206084 RepID=A0ABU0F6D7_9PSEU|nr:aldo/keto reductase [Amycolatopsis thermophila]MDQ0382600.1 aryl-alcohol dehydrogenase-like predicted oxidoreductase [Amycolatopsis thermophila]
MRYQIFGRQSGLRVSEYVLGTANFGSAPAATGLAGAKSIFEAFVAAGGTTFDVSNIYQNGEAEAVLGDLLGRERDDFVVITKYTGSRHAQIRPGTTGNSRKTMIRSLEESLRRLKTDYVDVFMPHFPDGVTPMPEILAGFEDLIRSGKVRYAGLSNFPAWRVAGAAVRSELGGHAPLAGIQTEYSLAERSADRELLPMAQAHGLGVLLYSPLAGGLLTGKYRRGEQGRLSAQATEGEGSAVLDAVLAVAEEVGTGPVQVALAWLCRRAAEATTSMVPVVGPRTPAHLEGYLDALDVEVGPHHYRLLDEVSAIRPGAPHEDTTAALAHGVDGDRGLLDVPLVPVV